MTLAPDQEIPGAMYLVRRAALRAQRAVDVTRMRLLRRPFRLLVVCGQKRSGNHLFINWALAQAHGPSLHYNHIHPAEFPTRKLGRTVHRAPDADPGALPTLLLSYEDRPLDRVMEGGLARFRKAMGDRVVRQDLIFVARDPRNLLASRFRKWPREHADPEARARVVARFAEYAGPVLDPPETLHGMRFTPVLYDALIASRPYRDTLSDRLGLRRTDRGLDEVPAYGRGSSFDGLLAQGRGRAMAVGDRWKAYADDPAFREVFATSPMDALASAFAETIAARRGAA